MKTIALTSTVFVLTAAGVLAEGSEITFLRARAEAQERKIVELEKEVNRLKGYHADKQYPKAVPVSTAKAYSASEYVVVKGDMLGRIAKRHNTTVAALKKANGLTSDHIRIGQKLRIPGAGEKPVAKAAVPVGEREGPLKTASAPVEEREGPLRTASTHVVRSGETFYSIARKYDISVTSLELANPKVIPSRIQVGQKLSIETNARPASRSHVGIATTGFKPMPKAKSPRPSKVAEAVPAPKPKASKTRDVVRNAPADRKAKSEPGKKSEPEIRTITVHKQITYGQFASQYGASTGQLNELNGLSLSKNTMLAIGSELYVPKD